MRILATWSLAAAGLKVSTDWNGLVRLLLDRTKEGEKERRREGTNDSGWQKKGQMEG